MNLTISYRHLDSTESLDGKIRDKADHLKKYFNGNVDVNWTCSIDGHDQHKSEVHVHAGHSDFHAHAIDNDLYKTLDKVLSKIEKQIQKKNSQIKDHIHR